MDETQYFLCRDNRGGVHIIPQNLLIQRTSAYGLIRREEGVLLVCDRSSDGVYDLPGGGIEENEDIIQGLKREIKEETGLLVVGSPKIICNFKEYYYDLDSNRGWESSRYYYNVLTEGQSVETGNNDDIVSQKFFAEPFLNVPVSEVAREITALSHDQSTSH